MYSMVGLEADKAFQMFSTSSNFHMSYNQSCWVFVFVLLSWEVISSRQDYRLRINQCISETLMNLFVFLQEMSHFKEQNPGKVSTAK